MRNRISIGLDVHARSVVGCALDGETGEIHRRTLTPDRGEILSWIRSLPSRVGVTYEACPTGFGLARFLLAADVDCLVAMDRLVDNTIDDVTANRDELLRLVSEMSDDQVALLLAKARTLAAEKREVTWPPTFVGMPKDNQTETGKAHISDRPE